ncbi:MAG: DUF1559 domain-containing protein [Planctomycetes bacterium]|nr:DUF1559 domain-containing protein [Planctomycetota bacterium]
MSTQMRLRRGRFAFSIIELLVVIGIIALLLALAIPATQRVREAASRLQCANNLRQIGLALHQLHDAERVLPAGVCSPNTPTPYRSWHVRLLPYLDQAGLWQSSQDAYQITRRPFQNPPHIGLATIIPVFACPTDGRTLEVQHAARDNLNVALTSYLGVSGTNLYSHDGIFFPDSRIRIADVIDGTSQTVMVGERPPSNDNQFGWWYAGRGQFSTGSCDMLLGALEVNILSPTIAPCPQTGHVFGPGNLWDPCSMFHFWSLHPPGAHFLFADVSVRMITYSGGSILPKLATRAGDEVVSLE